MYNSTNYYYLMHIKVGSHYSYLKYFIMLLISIDNSYNVFLN